MSNVEWKMCGKWLERCGMLTQEQNISLESVEHLASILKDGVILCNLLNRLKPSCIPYKNFSLRPQGSLFLSGKNIRAFLTYCKSDFQMEDRHLFKINDLIDFQDFGKVIFTLSKLSLTKHAIKWKIEPFEAGENTDYFIVEKKVEEAEDEYNSMEYGGCGDGYNDDSELIYDSLISDKTDVETSSSKKSKKEKCIDELVNTEKNFLDVLSNIVDKFMRKLKNHLNAEEFKTIFFKIDEIKQIHTEFYGKLQQASLSPHAPFEIARCFLQCYTSMVVYGEYSSRLVNAQQELERICQCNQTVADIVKKGSEIVRVKLCDLLIIPIQRILKYHLVVKELMKHCQKEETEELKKAHNILEDLNLYINEVKRDYENISSILDVQKSIVDLDKYLESNIKSLDCYGRRHFDGDFEMKRQFFGGIQGKQVLKSFSKGYIFLFDKLIIFCTVKKKGEQYCYIASLAIRSLNIQSSSCERGIDRLVLSDSENVEDKFIISNKNIDNILKLYNYIELAKGNCCPEAANMNGYQFILTNFKDATFCSVCKKLLRGMISQGYKCHRTNKTVHKECLTKVNNLNDNTTNTHATLPHTPGTRPPQHRSKPLPNLPTPTRQPPPLPPTKLQVSKSSPESYPWFSSCNSRMNAKYMLTGHPNGTFLVRSSEDNHKYVISLKYEHVRHLIIHTTKDGEFYLVKHEIFKSVPQLIEHYKHNSLETIFSGILMTLGQPYSELMKHEPRTCRALYDFIPVDAGQLGFHVGDVIEIISTKDEVWWKGKLVNKKGIDQKGNFPSNYVEVISCD